MFWNNLRSKANDLAAEVKKKAAQFNNATFKEGTMAICALVALADSELEKAERSRIASVILKTEALQVFDVAELKAEFERYCDELSDDFDFAKIGLVQKVGRLKGKPEAEYAVGIALLVANADGTFEDSEKEVVTEICRRLGLNPADYVQ